MPAGSETRYGSDISIALHSGPGCRRRRRVLLDAQAKHAGQAVDRVAGEMQDRALATVDEDAVGLLRPQPTRHLLLAEEFGQIVFHTYQSVAMTDVDYDSSGWHGARKPLFCPIEGEGFEERVARV
jgi:hypothetical protein